MKRVALIALPLLAAAAVVAWRWNSRPVPTEPEIVDAKSLTTTVVVADLDAPLIPGRSIVWCGTFQIAWNAMTDDVVKSPIRLTGDPPAAVALAQRRFSREDLSEASHLAIAGKASDGVIDRLRAELSRRFPAARVEIPTANDPHDLVAFAYLEKALPYREPFDRLSSPIRFAGPEGPVAVTGFGFDRFDRSTQRDDALQGQLRIVDWKSPDDFVIRLITSQADHIILAKVAPGATLAATVDKVLLRLADTSYYKPTILYNETLAVPIIRLAVRRSFDELLGRHLSNPGFEPWFVKIAEQVIRFRLDEKGVQLASASTLLNEKSGGGATIRTMIFDKPFLLLLREPDKRPYLAMWIATPELLEPQVE